MASFVHIPPHTLECETLNALLEEYATRDGTDYGIRETDLATRCQQLNSQLQDGRLMLLFDLDSETWDLLDAERARPLLAQAGTDER